VEHLEREVGVLLRRSRALNRESAARIHPDLNFEAYSILVRLDDLTQARPSDLARFFRIGKPTLSRQVKLLEELELVSRVADSSDARAVLLTLTDPGRTMVRAARAARRAATTETLGSWGADTLETFAALTQRLNAALSPDVSDDVLAAETSLPPRLPRRSSSVGAVRDISTTPG